MYRTTRKSAAADLLREMGCGTFLRRLKKMKQLLLLLCSFHFLASAQAVDTVDLGAYLPESNQVVLSKASGAPHARYTFTKSHSGFTGLYASLMDQGKPGYHYVWQKEYMIAGSWCTKTYAILFVGQDGSVKEVGDWLSQGSSCSPSIAFGYRDWWNKPTGLVWVPPGGLKGSAVASEMHVAAQASPGAAYAINGYRAFSKTGLVEVLPSMTIGQFTFRNVVHLVMYHGTRSPTPTPVRCDHQPTTASGSYYQSFKDYSSYAIELWLAPGVGVIKENTPFIEDASYWGAGNCIGQIFEPEKSWATFITSTLRSNPN